MPRAENLGGWAMTSQSIIAALAETVHLIGPARQMITATIAAFIGVITYRYTRRQNALALINHNNTLANQMNCTIIQSEEARQALGRLHDPVVGCPDDAVLFIYLNYVHNTFRMHRIGAVTAQVWRDTLAACVLMVGRLRPDQLERLLSRGYENDFRAAVLAGHAAGPARRPHLARPRLVAPAG
jgi:hypothetical protein